MKASILNTTDKVDYEEMLPHEFEQRLTCRAVGFPALGTLEWLVDLTRLPADRGEWPQGVGGEDPRDATPGFGESLIEATLDLIGAKLDELGI